MHDDALACTPFLFYDLLNRLQLSKQIISQTKVMTTNYLFMGGETYVKSRWIKAEFSVSVLFYYVVNVWQPNKTPSNQQTYVTGTHLNFLPRQWPTCYFGKLNLSNLSRLHFNCTQCLIILHLLLYMCKYGHAASLF